MKQWVRGLGTSELGCEVTRLHQQPYSQLFCLTLQSFLNPTRLTWKNWSKREAYETNSVFQLSEDYICFALSEFLMVSQIQTTSSLPQIWMLT